LGLKRGLLSEKPETNFLSQGLADVLLSEFLGHNIFKLRCGFWILYLMVNTDLSEGIGREGLSYRRLRFIRSCRCALMKVIKQHVMTQLTLVRLKLCILAV
jgi:hypothetical protein